MHTMRFILGCVLLAIASPANAQQMNVQEAPAAASTQTLTPGDKIQITVFRMPELSGEFTIGSDGTIGHPLYHAINVTDISLDSVTARIRTLLLKLQTNPQFVVQPLFRVAVGGEVRQPNLYTLPPQTTVAQAVAQAGGATQDGNLRAVTLIRNGSETVLDLTRPGDSLASTQIRSGDQILVQPRRSVFREYIIPLGSVAAGIAALVSILGHR